MQGLCEVDEESMRGLYEGSLMRRTIERTIEKTIERTIERGPQGVALHMSGRIEGGASHRQGSHREGHIEGCHIQ